jgi:hypothetical protein
VEELMALKRQDLVKNWWVTNIPFEYGILGVEIRESGDEDKGARSEGLRGLLDRVEIFITIRELGAIRVCEGTADIVMVHEKGGYTQQDMDWLKFEDLEKGRHKKSLKFELVKGPSRETIDAGDSTLSILHKMIVIWGMAKIGVGEEAQRKKNEERPLRDETNGMEWDQTLGEMGTGIGLWADRQVTSDRRWDSWIVDITTGKLLNWDERNERIRLAVEECDKEKFWVATWENTLLVAAEIGSREQLKVGRMVMLLEKDEEGALPDKGTITELNGKEKTDAWEQEFINSTWSRGISGHEINRALYGEVEEAYGVVIHRDNGIMMPPDEIELRRRIDIGGYTGREGEGWLFTIYDEWVVAVAGSFMEGPWNAYDKIAKELGGMVIGPMTTEYGDGRKWEKEKGEILMKRIEADGTLNNKGMELEMDENIKMTAVGEPGDGILLGEIKIRLNERWATEESHRVEQLRECVRAKMKMYRIKGAPSSLKGENIDIDFDGGEGDVWTRGARDRAGEEWLDIRSLTKLSKKTGIVLSYRQDGLVKKIRIGSSSFKDLVDQIENKCMEWGRSIHVWSANSTIWAESTQQEEELLKSGEDEQFETRGVLVYGITRDMIDMIPAEELALMIADVAKTGIRGAGTKFGKLKSDLTDITKMMNLTCIGLTGVKKDKGGILVDLKNRVRSGLVEGHGIRINEWRNYKLEKKPSHPELKVQMTRQLLSQKEYDMVLKGMVRKHDYLVVAARGLTRIGGIDDIMRRSFKSYLEEELKINVFVWIVSIKHADDRGIVRDEPVMIGLVSEEGGERMSTRIPEIRNKKRKGMMMLEGVDIQIFRDAKDIWNTTKPNMLGAADRHI